MRETAHRLFLTQGYAPTTMRQIAKEAGVAERTVYVVFPSKAAVLHELIGLALAGGEDGPKAEEADYESVAAEQGAVVAIERFAADTTQLYERAGALLELGEYASESDPELRVFSEAGARATLGVLRTLAVGLHRAGALRSDLEIRHAVDSAYAISHFANHRLLRARRRWSRARYERWLVATLASALLDPDRMDGHGLRRW